MHKKRLGPIIDKKWADSVLSSRDTDEEKAKSIPAVPISFRNATLRQLLEAEPLAVQDDVEAWRQAQQQTEVANKEEDDEEAIRFKKANAYHK